MKKLFILAVLVGSILAEPGWDPGMTYIYSINTKSLSTLNEFGNDYQGVIIKGFLKLQAGSAPNVTLNGQLTDLQYADIHTASPNECTLPQNETSVNWKQINLSNTTFGVKVKDGMVEKMFLSKDTTTKEANIIRTYLSQLQTDLEGKNKIASKIFNKDYQMHSASTSFSTMEESVTGQCETIYDISPLPENVIRSKPTLAPILNSSQESLNVMDVVKISNFSNCKRHLVYHRGMNGKKNWDTGFSNIADVINRKTEGRLILNGTLQNYTIHSTVIEDKIFVTPSLYKKTKGMTVSCVNLTLVQVKKSELPLLLNFEINTTLSFDYQYKSKGNIDITSDSFNVAKDPDSENRTRNAREVNRILKSSYNYRHVRDTESSSPDVYNNTTDIPISTPTGASNLSEENTTSSFLSNSTTITPPIENSTTVTHTQNSNVETSSEIGETSTVPSTDETNVVTSTTANDIKDETISTLVYDIDESVSTMSPDILSNISSNTFENISSVLQFLNVSNGLQKLHLSTFTSIYPNNNKSALSQRDIEHAIKAVSENIASHILNFKSVIHENVLSSFCQLTFLISNVEFDVIHRVSNILYQSPQESDEKQRLAWVVFRDAVAQSGTGPALILIKEWILYNKTTTNEAKEIFEALPRTSELPNEEYIDGLFGIVQDSRIQKQESVHASAVLAFSNLIYQVQVDSYSQKALYPVHIFGPMIVNTYKLKDVYLKYLEKQLENAVEKEDSCKIHIYIRALCNVAHPEILNIFKKYLISNSTITTFQKTFIVMSLEKITDLYPEETRNFLYPIYIDDKEHYEIRTAAVFQIMHTKPPANILKKIVEMTQFDSSNQVIAAVKSSVQSAAQLTNPEDEEFKENAKSVMHLLNSKNLGIQYSYHSFKSQMIAKLGNLGYRQSFSYIGSDNSIVPKGLFINMERFLGGLTAGKEYYGVLFSDTKKMSLILENLWNVSNTDYEIHSNKKFTYKQDNIRFNEENQKNVSNSFSPIDIDNKNSSKNIHEDQDEPESVMFLHFANGEKFITFGKNFSSSIKNWLQQKARSLKTGYKFNYSKLFQRDVFGYAVPNAAGFITQVFYRVPTIYHLSGKVKFNFQKSQQQSYGGLKTEYQNMALSGRLNLGYALNKHTDIGFVTPFNGNRYIVGYKEQLLINIPITVNTTTSSSDERINIRTTFSPITKDTMWFYSQFNSQLYRQHDALSDIVNKKQSASTVQITDSLLKQEIVQRLPGLLLNASLPQIGNYQGTAEGNMYTSFYYILNFYEKLKSVHNINIIFRADFPSDRSSVTLQTLYENVINESTQEADSKLDFSTRTQTSNRHPVKGINNSMIIEWSVFLNEDKKPKYSASLNYTWSEFSNNTKCFISMYEAPTEKYSHLSPKITFQFDGIWAKVPLFNFSKAISTNPQSEFKATLFLGSSDKPIAITECNLQRTAQRKNYILEQPETKSCQKEMQEGNYMLPPCQLASQNANYLDQHNCSITIEGLNEINKELMIVLNFIHMTHNNFFYYPRRHTGLQNQISVLTQFAPNFNFANVTILFPNTEAKFNDVSIHYLLGSIVKVHPEQTAITQTAQSLLGNQYSPTCVLDKTKLNTFDNQTYSVKFGPCWFVLMALTYQSAADPKLSKNNILILIRDTNEGRVMRMMIGDDVVDITTQEPQNSYKYINVNNMQYRVPKNKVAEIALSSKNNSEKLFTTVVDEIIKLQFTNISVIFDGTRVQLMIGNKYRNQTLGLCGTFTGEEYDDFILPIDCNITDPKQFIASYAILNNNTCTEQGLEWAEIAMNKSCSLTGDTFIRSDFPKSASCHLDHNKVSDPRCMSRYNEVLVEDKLTCFSQHALTKCKPSCYPLKMVTKNMKFHCVETAILSKHFVEIVKSGKVHDFSSKPTSKNVTVDIPAGCYKC